MNDKLKVLDMSEEEQLEWLIEKGITDGSLARSQVTHKIVSRWIRIEFADLAFRFRDEAISNPYLHDAMIDVHQAVEGPQDRKMNFIFWSMRAKPIHWILAALIAKETK